MAWASGEVVSVLVFLLPGFVAASVFHSLTSHPKPDTFDRLIQALVFTLIAHIIAGFIQAVAPAVTPEAPEMVSGQAPISPAAPAPATGTPNTAMAAMTPVPPEEIWKLVLTVLISVILALITVYWSNNDKMHGILRRLGITKETSYPSEWYSTFWRLNDCYVVLHLKGERRLYGWPEEWPSQPDRGHFRISECEWLKNDENDGVSTTGVSAILIPANDVEMVEFIKGVDEQSEE